MLISHTKRSISCLVLACETQPGEGCLLRLNLTKGQTSPSRLSSSSGHGPTSEVAAFVLQEQASIKDHEFISHVQRKCILLSSEHAIRNLERCLLLADANEDHEFISHVQKKCILLSSEHAIRNLER
eukprot:g17215.t1